MAEKMTLLPCPFCGAPAAKNKNPGDRWVYYCPNGHTGYLRHKEWQARAHLAQPAQAVKAVDPATLDHAVHAYKVASVARMAMETDSDGTPTVAVLDASIREGVRAALATLMGRAGGT